MFPRSGLKIARILGIDIVVNPTWLLIFVLVGFSMTETFRTALNGVTVVGGRVFPGGPWPWVAGFLTALVFFACLLAHELSHSFVAKRNGISINRITLFIFGGVAEMSEDVPSANIELKMAVAGPLMTFMLFGAFYGFYRLAYALDAGPVIIAPLFYLAGLNLFIGIFNLLPGFPLDGGRVLRAILWKTTGDLRKATRAASIGGQVVAALIAAWGVYLIVIRIPVSGVWLLLIGVFVFQLSRAGYRQTLLRLATADTRVSDIMYTDVPVIDANTTLTDLRNNYFSVYHLPAFPVAEGGRLVGIVDREDLASVARPEWDILDTGRVARPLGPGQVVGPDTPLDRFIRGALSEQEYVLVAEGDEVKGLVTRDELTRYIDTRVKLAGRRGGERGSHGNPG